MKLFKGILHEDLGSMIARELEKTKIELFTAKLHLESEQGRVQTLMTRQARLEKEQNDLKSIK